jgi:hypothetical protein
LQPNARIPAALGQKRLWIGDFQDFAQGAAFVGGVLIIAFDDAIADPIAEVAPGLVSVPL